MRFPLRNPFRPSAQSLLDKGIEAEAAGDSQQARRCYGDAIKADPLNAAAHCNLGLLALQVPDYAQADTAFRTALSVREDFPEAWVGLAEVLEASGRNDEALAALERAAGLRANFAGALFNASALLRKMGRVAEAEKKLQALPAGHPDYYRALLARADLLQTQGRKIETVRVLFEALAIDSTDALVRQSLAYALYGSTLANAGDREKAILASLCEDDHVFTPFLASSIVGILKAEPGCLSLLASLSSPDNPFENPGIASFLQSPLLIASLPRTVFADPALEIAFTKLRRLIALGAPAPAEFTNALARHCFRSAYAFSVDHPEAQRVEGARQAAESELLKQSPDLRTLESALSIVALYQPLHTLATADRLPGLGWSRSFLPVVEEQVVHRQRERELAAKLQTLTAIDNPTSKAVRAQYEENPYPPWSSLQYAAGESLEALSSRLRPSARARIRPRPVQILVAGCGTGLHPIQAALSRPDSTVLAIDLSTASLAYAARMAEHFGATNITFAQADLLDLPGLGRKFDIIECAGVLHHLKDPLQGWEAIAGLLHDDGLMRVALYSTRARAAVRASRALIDELKIQPTAEGIRRCRRMIVDLPEGHPARAVLSLADFYNLSGCRDLLMHVQEHTFTVPGIAGMLSKLGLELLEIECANEIRERFAKRFPEASAGTDPLAWDRFESAYPDTFAGMIHFWCGKAGRRIGEPPRAGNCGTLSARTDSNTDPQ